MKPAATGCLASKLQDITASRAQPTDRREARREFGFVISRSNSVMIGMRTMRKAGSQERGESCFDYSCIPAFLREFGFVISRSNSVMVGMRTMRKAGSQERGESCFDYSCIPAFLSAAQLVLIAFG